MFAESVKNKIMFGETNTNKNNQLNIVFGVDENFICHMGVCLTSIVMNNLSLNFNFHIIVDDINDADAKKIEKLANEYNVKINIYYIKESVFDNWPIFPQFPKSVYYRILAPEVIKDAETLLYLDADMICLGDLSPLLKLDLGDNIAAVIPDRDDAQEKQKRLLNLTGDYFNSGFLFIKLENWHKNQINKKIVDFFAQNSTVKLPDQDALNVILQKKVQYMDSKWNYLYKKYSNRPVILHFASRPKPWQLCYQSKKNEYLFYKELSFWSETPLLEPRLYREKRLYAIRKLKDGNIFAASTWFIKYIIHKYLQ